MPAPAPFGEGREGNAFNPPNLIRRAVVALLLGALLGLVTALLQPRKRSLTDAD